MSHIAQKTALWFSSQWRYKSASRSISKIGIVKVFYTECPGSTEAACRQLRLWSDFTDGMLIWDFACRIWQTTWFFVTWLEHQDQTFIHFTVCCMLPCRHWAPNQTYGRILNTETLPQLLRHNLNMIKMWKLYNTPNISQDYGRILNKEALPQFLRHNQIMTKMWKLGNTPNTSQAPHALSTSFDQPRMTRVSVGCPHHMVHFCEKMLIYWEQDS